MAKKKETKKKPETKIHATWLPARGAAAELKKLLNEAAPKIVAEIAHEQGKMLDAEGSGTCCGTKIPHGHTREISFPAPGSYEIEMDYVSASEARQNRLDLYDGTAELKVVFERCFDLFSWVNDGDHLIGKAGRLIVRLDPQGYGRFSRKPFFSKEVTLTPFFEPLVSDRLYERASSRAGQAETKHKVIHFLNKLG